MEYKIWASILNVLGVGVFGWAFILTWEDFRSWVVFIIAIILGIYKIAKTHMEALKQKYELDEIADKRRERKSKKAPVNKKLNNTKENE